MTDFYETWALTRGRFDSAVQNLSAAQLQFRPYENVLTIGEMAIHVAGVEASFGCQLKNDFSDSFLAKIAMAATDGVVNENPFPIANQEISPELVNQALSAARQLIEPMVSNPDPWREIEIKSALGPMINGTGAFARLGYHPGYHHGQVHMIVSHPDYPKS